MEVPFFMDYYFNNLFFAVKKKTDTHLDVRFLVREAGLEPARPQ